MAAKLRQPLCMQAPPSFIQLEGVRRDNQLSVCLGAPGAAACDSYAKTAVRQNEENISRGCNFSGNAWQSDYDNHLAACLQSSAQVAQPESTHRANQLSVCRHDPRSGSCDVYASSAVAAYNENIQRGCGFSGAAWQPSYDSHFGWCMSAQQSSADSETANRRNALNTCGHVPPPQGCSCSWKCLPRGTLGTCETIGEAGGTGPVSDISKCQSTAMADCANRSMPACGVTCR